MAQPELIKDIEARVKKSGDTMTGNLSGKYFQGTWLQTTAITDLGSSPSQIAVISEGWIYYRTPAELAKDIGLTGNYVLKSGDTMTGNLTAPTFIGSLQGNASSSYKFYETQIPNNTDLNALKELKTYSNASTSSISTFINKPSGMPVGAMRLTNYSHGSASNFTQEILSAAGAKQEEFIRYYYNGSFSTWKKRLTSDNFSDYAYPITGGNLTGTSIGFGNGNESFITGAGWITDIGSGYFSLRCCRDASSLDKGIYLRHTGSGEEQYFITDKNYSSYVPSKTGTGATGSWPITAYGYYQTIRNFTNGTLVTTDLPGRSDSQAFYMKVEGNCYGEGLVFAQVSGYEYNVTANPASYPRYINISGQKAGIFANVVTAFANANGNLCFWWPKQGYWHGYNIYVYDAQHQSNSKNLVNHVVSVTNEVLPSTRYHSTEISMTQIWRAGDSITGAVWNDYAECREADTIEPGYVLIETGDDSLTKSTERLSPFAGVSSDTWGFSQGETDKAKTPIAVAGRVLVYPWQDRNNYKSGDCVCAAPEGKVDIMTRKEIIQYPDRIVGIVSSVPTYKKWGGGENTDREPVDVNGRIWIKVR